ncbi:arsenate reductase family protein [Faecalispora anaeroviscerum]|uniref:arsenate reductase family protein n=1 Tax=Faecalispora anaeroviscerum TaxID=2991836 RepID=UPI0024BAF28C|nr:arsenate reductase family protein [Faecalispora anaeroviscerum]
MDRLFVCYPKCTTCQKAERWLKEHGIAAEMRNIKEQNPSQEELTRWFRASGLPLKKFFNTSGMVYREMELSKKLPGMSEEEQLALLSTDGMLVKRPILTDGNTVLVGFHEKEWEQALLK